MRASKNVIIFAVVTLLVVFFSAFAAVFSIAVLSHDSMDQLSISEKYRYHLHYLNPKTGEKSLGLVNLVRDLGDGFDTFGDSSGGLFIVSNDATDEYYCTGTCYCENERRYAGVVSRSMMYLVAAFASTIAFKISQQYFEDECKNKFADEPCSSIRADVDDCRFLHAVESTTTGEKGDEAGTSVVEGSDVPNEKKRRYQCTGNCLQGEISERDPGFVKTSTELYIHDTKPWDPNFPGTGYIFDQMRKGSAKVNCKELQITSDLELTEGWSGLYEGWKVDNPAEWEFAMRKLDPFCRSQSLDTIDIVSTIEDAAHERRMKISVHYCDPGIGKNPTVKCVEIL